MLVITVDLYPLGYKMKIYPTGYKTRKIKVSVDFPPGLGYII